MNWDLILRKSCEDRLALLLAANNRLRKANRLLPSDDLKKAEYRITKEIKKIRAALAEAQGVSQ